MSQKIVVDLEFRANTDAAKKQVQSLQQTLTSAINASMNNKTNLGITPQLEQARLSAMQLKSALQAATNVDTGRLNLHKFTNNLRKSGLSVKQLGAQLKMLGPEGTQAFHQMATAMATAETKVLSLQGGMRRLMTTFGNTLRYQASAYAIQAVTSSISEAISYTKELDKALTDISMVTSMGAEDMKRFSVQASKAAKSLSTATTEYVKASHIYFQQGLDVGESMKRAEVTIKLAHATGESMEQVSDWMTAVWNNFDNGTKTLEYYADVLAELGAATASSADEIAKGLEKFAAVAETVGLSYEYAASALATITAETRQSADVVGTALKTLFARMEGLKLGETLDDGTTLNQYSLALQTVGINIKDANGELKDMDTILDETAAKWATLARDEQVALAQSVAGMRQYAHFVSLMDNYDVMQSNIEMSKAATGSLEKMHQKHRESLEGIQNESKVAGEKLISALMDEEDVKSFYKMMTGIMEFATKLTKAFGGLEGILLMAANALTQLYQPQIASMFSSMAAGALDLKTHLSNIPKRVYNTLHPNDQKDLNMTYAEQQRADAAALSKSMAEQEMGGIASGQISEKIYELRMRMLSTEDKLTDAQKDQLQWQIQLLEKTRDVVGEKERELEKERQINEEKANGINSTVMSKKDFKARTNELSGISNEANQLTSTLPSARTVGTMGYSTSDRMADAEKMRAALTSLQEKAQSLNGDISSLGFEDALADVEAFKNGSLNNLTELETKLQNIQAGVQNMVGAEMSTLNAPSSQLEVDTDYIRSRSGAVGQAEGSMDNTLSIAKGFAGAELDSSQVEQFRSTVGSALQDVISQIQDLDLKIDGVDFEQLTAKVNEFSAESEGGVQDVINDLERLKQKLNEAGSQDINSTVQRAAMGSVNTDMQALNTLSTVGSIEGGPQVQAAKIEQTVDKMGDSEAKTKLKSQTNNLKQLQEERKAIKAKQEQEKQGVTSKKKLAKIDKEYGKQLADNKKKMEDQIKAIQKTAKAEGDKLAQDKKGIKNGKQYKDLIGQRGKAMNDLAQSERKAGASTATLNGQVQQAGETAEQTATRILSAKSKIDAFGQGAAAVFSTLMSVTTGINMLYNGVASLTTALDDGTLSFDEFLSVAMALAPALLQLGGPITKVIGWFAAKAAARMAGAKLEDKAADVDVKAEGKRQAANIATALTELGKWITKGPAGWIIAGISAAALLALGIGAVVNMGVNKGNEEIKEEELEETREVNSAATEVGKTLNSIGEQVDTFKNLRESGQSTISVLEDMKNSLADLGTQIDELFAKGANTTQFSGLTTLYSELQTHYDDLVSGRISADEYKGYVDSATQEVNQATTYNMMKVMKSSGTDEDLSAYTKQVGTTVTSSDTLMAEAEQKFHSKQYSTVEDAQRAWADAAIDAALGPEYADEDWAESNEAISQLMSYAPISVHRIINALKMFAPNGAISNKYGQDRATMAFEWAGNNQSKLAYANNIDFSKSPVTWNEQYMQALQQGEEAKITQSAEKLGYNTQVFETYTDLLVDSNKYLSENNATAKQLAVNNLSLNKGLKTLSDSWDNISKVLRSGKRGTIEYAEALGKIKTSMEEAFGYAPSTEFIEANLGTIEELANGNVEVLDELQSRLAEDLVYNLDYKTALNGENMSPQQIRETLLGLLSQLDDDMDLEMGQNASISQEYLNTLQAMLDSGQMTADELDKLMRAKGFEIEYDGWKEIPGPSSRVRQDYYHAGETKPYKTDYIETSETLTVPIVNGEAPDPGVQTVGNVNSKATIKKSSSASAINSSIFEKADDAKKKIAEEAERYYTLDKALERLQREYDSISEAKSRAFGQSHLDLLTQEIAKTHELANVTKEKLAKAEEFLLKDREALSKYGVSFDEYGNVANYDALMKNFSQSGDEKTYGEFKDALSQYEETLSQTQDLDKEIKNYANQVLDLKLEAIQYQVEVRVQIADDDLAYIEYQLEHLVDPAVDAAKAIDLIGQKMNLAKSKSDEYRRGLELLFDDTLNDEQLNALKNGDFSVLEGVELDQAQIDMIRDYRDSLLEENRSLYAAREEFFETISSGLDSWNEQFSEVTDEVAFFASVIDTYKNVIDLVGRKNLGVSADYMNKLSQSQVNNSIAATKAAKEQLEFNKQALQQLKEERDTALAGAQTDEDRARMEQDWKETIKTAEEEVRSLEEAVQSSWTDALTAAAEAFETSVNLAAEAFEEVMSGIYGTFDSLQKAFDRVITANERYISDYTKIYELSKLNRNINKQIDNNDSVKAKTTLRELQEEINALQESETEMTQYDLEYLQKKYDLRLAEIALEEAQNAKTQVRMRRDSEGNWGYVYTANEAAQDAAQQNYEDKLYASQNHTKQRISDLQNQIVENERNMIEELKALPLENYEEEKQRVLEYYADQERFLIQQIEIAIGNSAEIYKVDWEKYAEKTGYKISANEDWVDSWEETVLAQLTGFDSLTDYYAAFEEATSKLVTELSSSYATWQTNIGAAFDAAGQNVKTFAQDAEGALNTVDQSVKDIIDNLTNKETGLGAQAAAGFQSLINAVHDKYAKYEAEILPYINANNKIIESLNTIIKKQGEVADVQSGYYGTVTVGGVTYRTADKYDTKEEAQSAASKMATDYIASAKAYNTDSNTNTYSNESLQAVSNSVTTVDGLSGLNYSTDLKMVSPYVKPASNLGLNNSFENYTPPPTANVPHSKYTQKTYSTTAPTFWVNDDSVKITRLYLDEQGHLIEDWHDSLSKGGYWLQILTGSGLGKNSGKIGLLGYMGTKDQYVTGGTSNTYNGIPSEADVVSVKQIKDTIKDGKYTSLWGFDTGGYTGSWDSSGRLAVLHQKEIVLNAHDTENFLAAVNIVRDIASKIDLKAAAQTAALSAFTAMYTTTTPQTIEQSVTIHAEFPNATNHSEIEEAFSTLINRAAQFANQKN